MRFYSAALLSVAVVGACAKKDEPPPAPSVTAAPTPASTPAPTTPPAPPPAAAGLDCDKILGKDLRDKYFKGFTFENVPQPVASTGECKLSAADGITASFAVTCNEHMAAAMQPTIDGLKKAMKKMKDVPGVGKAAVMADQGDIGTSVSAWDDDSNCSIVGLIPKGTDAIAFTKDALAAFPRK